MAHALSDTAAASEPSRGAEVHTWKPLRYFNLYRLALAGLFAVAYFAGPTPPSVLGSYEPALFGAVCLAYLTFAIAAVVAHHFRIPAFVVQVYVQLLADIVAITLMMAASGGTSSGIGVLLVITIAGGSLLIPGRLAILFAALAALAVLAEQIAAVIKGGIGGTFAQAGILGAAYFATAIIAYLLARRIRESEALAARRGADLANLEKLNETIIRRLEAGVLVVDHAGCIRLANEAARRLLRIRVRSHEGRGGVALDTVSAGLAAALKRWREQPAREPEPFQTGPQRATVQPRFTQLGAGAGAGTLVFLHDAAELARQAQQLKLASLGRLTASIAHEIRNPLGAISHAAQLLAESPRLEAGDGRLTQIIREQSDRVNTIVENVLQLSRGRPTRAEPVAIRGWLADFAREFALTHHLDPACLRIEVEPAGLEIPVDTTHLHQVLWNLGQNALEHGNAGRTEPRITLAAGRDPESGAAYLEVRDPGPGLGAEAAQQAFEPFYTHSARGTGLGLCIARELCELNQAALEYVGSLDGESRFRATFHPHRSTEPA